MGSLSHVLRGLSTYARAHALAGHPPRHRRGQEATRGRRRRDGSPATGERKFKGVVRGLKRLGWKLDRVFTSPWLRARATAELLAPLGGGVPIATDLLTQVAARRAARADHRVRRRRREASRGRVVGHEPWLGELIAWLAFGDGRHGEGLVLKKGGVVWLEGSATPGGMSCARCCRRACCARSSAAAASVPRDADR